ncbi:MAG: carboxypeptidase regulatory-like domain-containing protein [Acidobacteria bacterium]|nr:carboxypeptidase regulatory-like domain-containing protein [Acidobacteriota bacterium]
MFPRTLILLLLILAFVGQAFTQTQTKIGTASIAGRVTLKGEPATGVFVGMQPQPSGLSSGPFAPDRSQYLRVQTDSEGRFKFSSLTAGQYRIVALAPGFASADDSPMGNGKMVNLADGETLESVELRLKRGAVITGRITDSSGNPMVEKEVQLMKMDARGNFSRFYFGSTDTRTDDRGVYRIHSLPGGNYKVSVGYSAEDGFRGDMSRLYFTKTFYPNTTDEKQAKVVELSEGSEASDIDIKIADAKKSFDIAGKVVEAETGKPVPGVRIGYGMLDPNGRIGGSVGIMASTDAQGEFQIPGVLPGKYLVFADARFDSQASTSDIYSDQTPVEVTDSDVTGVEVKAHRGGSVSGLAVVEGTNDPAILKQLSNINLSLGYSSGEQNLSSRIVRPNPDGSFRFNGVKPGKIMVRAYTPPDGLKLIRLEYSGAPITDGIEVQAGETITNVRVVFGYGTGVIRGQVKIVGGVIPEGLIRFLNVKPLSGAGSPFSVPVDSRNQFLVKNLPSGEYELRLVAYSENQTSDLAKLLSFLNKSTHRVTVGSGETPTEFVVDLSRKEDDK